MTNARRLVIRRHAIPDGCMRDHAALVRDELPGGASIRRTRFIAGGYPYKHIIADYSDVFPDIGFYCLPPPSKFGQESRHFACRFVESFGHGANRSRKRSWPRGAAFAASFASNRFDRIPTLRTYGDMK